MTVETGQDRVCEYDETVKIVLTEPQSPPPDDRKEQPLKPVKMLKAMAAMALIAAPFAVYPDDT